MNIRPEHIDSLRHLGYTDTEASFLYLVATHSGYLTQRQFLAFAQVQKGGLASRLIAKALGRKHLRAAQGAYNTHVYNLYSRRLYGAVDRENLRKRRRHSKELIQTRLLILDFVLAHLDERYLETEAEKVSYFQDSLGLELSCLPGRIYKGLRSNSVTNGHFVDAFPVLQPGANNKLSLPPVVTLPTSGQTRKRQQLAPSLQAASTTRPLPGRLSSHETISSNDWHFPPPPSSLACEEVSEASLEWRAITASGALPVLLLRKESAFQKWATQGLSNTEIDGLFGPRRSPANQEFSHLCAAP
jgi:hypothetical protein